MKPLINVANFIMLRLKFPLRGMNEKQEKDELFGTKNGACTLD